MGKVVVDMSVSLDGFVAARHDAVGRPLGEGEEVLHRWLFAGDRQSRFNPWFRLAEVDRQVLDAAFAATDALVVGRRPCDVAEGWGGNHPLAGVPVFVLTHRPPQEVPRGHTPLFFVTTGIHDAIARAREAAGAKDVGIAGTRTGQQALRAGLVDELLLRVVPVLLGSGVRLFEDLAAPVPLERAEAVAGPQVTHLRFRVNR